MGTVIWLLGVAVVSAGPDRTFDRHQLSRVLDATWGEVRDIEFLYEGSSRQLGRNDQTPGDFDDDFQGSFAFRNDDSAHIYSFVWPADPNNSQRVEILNFFKGRFGQRNRLPDSRRSPSNVDQVQRGAMASLTKLRSPLYFFMMPLLLELLRDESTPFESLGWEDIGGHRCLEVRFGRPGIYEELYWLDIERGGHPLRYEELQRSVLRSRRFDVELARYWFPGGKPCWLPARGKRDTFLNKSGGLSPTPTFEETYQVIDRTVRINRGLPDSRFSLDWSPNAGTEGLAKAIAEFNHPPAHLRRPRTAQEALDRVIAEANRQSAQIEASAPSRESWIRRNFAAATFVLVGLIVLSFAGYLKRRSA